MGPELEVVWTGSSWREPEPQPAPSTVTSKPAPKPAPTAVAHFDPRKMGQRTIFVLRCLSESGPSTAKQVAAHLRWLPQITKDALYNAVRYWNAVKVVEYVGRQREAIYAITETGQRLFSDPMIQERVGGTKTKWQLGVAERRRQAARTWRLAHPNYHREYIANRKRQEAQNGTR